MAEEKDDWLDAPADDDSDDSMELDQSDIDSLITGEDTSSTANLAAEGSGETESELDQSVIDSLLSEDNGDDDEELDQSAIDSLLSGDAAPALETADEGEEDGELDQSDIDSLLAGDDAPPPTAAEEDGDDELDQSNIDSLLAGGDEPAAAEDEELEQSDIDTLLSGEPADEQESSPDQDEIDQLFADIDSDSEPKEEPDPFQAEEIDFQEVLNQDDDDESFLTAGNEFASDEFDIDDDIPDIPDIPTDDDDATVFEAREETVVAQEATETPTLQEGTVHDEETKKSIDLGNFSIPVALPEFLQDRKNQGIAAACLVLLIVVAISLFSGGDEELQVAKTTEIEKQVQEQVAPAQPAAPLAPNTPPSVHNQEFVMPSTGAIPVILAAQDEDGDELTYEILSHPKFGKLSGQAPNLIYSPDANFPGEDHFDFRVGDGRDLSTPRLANIVGPIMAKKPETHEKKGTQDIKPRKLIVSAKSLFYSVVSPETFIFDWETIWNEANYLPYSPQVAVEVLSDTRLGSLKKTGSNTHSYRARKFVSGQETIRYRFKLGKLRSKIRTISLAVSSGNPAPEIKLQPINPSYLPGEIVTIDAGSSMDDDRNSLLFSWQQVTGVPVQLEVLNQEGSKVTFMAPSSFSNSINPGPMLRLTAIDKTGKTSSVDIKVPTKSRYKSALWGMNNS